MKWQRNEYHLLFVDIFYNYPNLLFHHFSLLESVWQLLQENGRSCFPCPFWTLEVIVCDWITFNVKFVESIREAGILKTAQSKNYKILISKQKSSRLITVSLCTLRYGCWCMENRRIGTTNEKIYSQIQCNYVRDGPFQWQLQRCSFDRVVFVRRPVEQSVTLVTVVFLLWKVVVESVDSLCLQIMFLDIIECFHDMSKHVQNKSSTNVYFLQLPHPLIYWESWV